MTVSDPASGSKSSQQMMPTFCVMWACAAIFHQLAALKGMTKPPGFLLVVAAFVLIARPRSIPCMAVLMLLQIWEAWTHLPGSNHWLFTALVNVTFLLTLVVVWLRERKSGPSTVDRFSLLRPPPFG